MKITGIEKMLLEQTIDEDQTASIVKACLEIRECSAVLKVGYIVEEILKKE